LDLYSVNYLHFGAPKFWYAIAPEDRERFEILAQGMVPEMWRACPEFLRHKELLISPTLLEQNGIPFTRMVQHPGEFVVTYPGSYHSGFNTGFNCAESCNFATEAWVEYGECAGSCECVPDSVKLDMSIFEDEENGVCKLVDEDDYTRIKRGRVGEPRRRPTGEEDVKVKREKEEQPKKEKAHPMGRRELRQRCPGSRCPPPGTRVSSSPRVGSEPSSKSPQRALARRRTSPPTASPFDRGAS
jgi:jumonji domain-containing protein 2